MQLIAHSLPVGVLLAVLSIAAYTDIRWRRIPNKVTFPALLAGIFLNSVFYGWHGFTTATMGVLAGGGILFLLYLLRMMGAGDVKLLAAVGAFLGGSEVMNVLFLAIFIGGFLALCFKVKEGIDRKRQKSAKQYIQVSEMDRNGAMHPQFHETVPYGVAIATGTFLIIVRQYMGRI